MMIMPFVLVVQLVMSGVVFALEGISELVSHLTASRWGVEAINTIARTDKTVNFQAAWADAGDGGAGVLCMDWLILLVFSAVYIAIAILMLRRVDKDER